MTREDFFIKNNYIKTDLHFCCNCANVVEHVVQNTFSGYLCGKMDDNENENWVSAIGYCDLWEKHNW